MSRSFIDSLVSSRLDEALTIAATGKPLILRARRSTTKDKLLERAVNGYGGLEPICVDPKSGLPQQALLDAASSIVPRLTSLKDIATAQDLEFKLFVVDVRDVDATAWLTLAGSFGSLRAAGGDGPSLALIAGAVSVPANCELLDDGGLIGPSEAAVYVRDRCEGGGLLKACADAAAIEVSRGDLEQLDGMLALSDRDRFDPSPWVSGQPISEAKLLWRGKEEVCATWLAAKAQKRLRHRVWRGHVGVMFPWLAEALGAVLEEQARKLPASLPDKYTNQPIARGEFEWGDIVHALRPIAPTMADCAHRLRVLRNSLAHQRPLTWESSCRAELDLERLLRWR